MFEIKVHSSAPELMKTMGFWCRFLVGTHWRKFGDNAEIIIEHVDYRGYGEIECLCKAFNNKYSMMGHVIRDFPIGYSFMGDRTNIETLTKYGFHLVPDAIHTRNGLPSHDDSYYNNMINLDWNDNSLYRPQSAYKLEGITGCRRFNDPIALFNLGIPVGRLISIKGLVIGNDNGPNYSYNNVY